MPVNEEFKEAFDAAGLQLLNTAYDTLVALDTNVLKIAEQSTDYELKAAAAELEKTEDIMYEFIQADAVDVALMPRVIRDVDVKKISSGEHAGVSVRYIAKGQTIIINCYGGLRDAKAAIDERDFGGAKPGHADRSIDTASRPTELNIHVIEHNKTQPHVNIWMKFLPTQISLSTFQIEGKTQDVHGSIPQNAAEFKLSSTLFQTMKKLTGLVPNSYSPR